MVYLPDKQWYDIFPEYQFRNQFQGPCGRQWPMNPRYSDRLYGTAIQALRVDDVRQGTVDGMMAGMDDDYGRGSGVRLVQVLKNGEMMWWSIEREEDPTVGIGEILI